MPVRQGYLELTDYKGKSWMTASFDSSNVEFWDKWVKESFDYSDNPDNVRRKLYVLKEVEKRKQPGLKILDVGCGNGWLSRELKQFGEVTATDFSSAAMLKLQKRYPDIRWIGGDFLSIEISNNYYDLVTCLETIAHVPDQESFARRIAQVLRPGGTLLLTTQNAYIWNRTSWLKPPGEGQIRNWPSRKRLLELFGPYFKIGKILTCAPGGDRGFPWMLNNKVASKIGRTLLGLEKWMTMLEFLGLGRSLFVMGQRH
jgi:2-polyprenyl-3-methyl-5-hydroxy-6-metoxy-1,4-benzoquinol methylase